MREHTLNTNHTLLADNIQLKFGRRHILSDVSQGAG